MASRLAGQVRKNLSSIGIKHEDKLVIGVSGGADSVALLCLVCEWSAPRVTAVYVDHQLREGGVEESAFVASLAKRLGAGFIPQQINTREIQEQRRSGVEEAARVGRYEALTAVARDRDCRWILTAHTADDQAETVLWRLLRGGALESLTGISPALQAPSPVPGTGEGRESASGVRLVRPLLSIERQTLREYLQKRQQPFMEDPSNASMDFTRNRLRAQVMPLLLRENPSLVEGLCGLASEVREVESLLQAQTQEASGRVILRSEARGVVLSIQAMKREATLLQRRILHEALGRPFLSRGQVESLLRMLHAEGGRRVRVGDFTAARQHDELAIEWSA